MRDTPARIGLGIAVSLVVHLLLLTTLQVRMPERAADADMKRKAIEVFLPQPKPAMRVIPDSETPPVPRQPMPKAKPKADIRPTTPTPPINPARPLPEDEPQHEPPQPSIDLDAARASIPGILKQLDREKMEQPVGQLAAKPLHGRPHETRLARQVAKAGRPDCLKEVHPAGLLAPIFMAMEKKGTGCKW